MPADLSQFPCLQIVAGTNAVYPALGALAPPANQLWRLHAITFTLTTTAAVANRRPYIYETSAPTHRAFGLGTNSQPAGTAYLWSFASGLAVSQTWSGTVKIDVMPPDLWLSELMSLTVDITGGQAGDAITDLHAHVSAYNLP